MNKQLEIPGTKRPGPKPRPPEELAWTPARRAALERVRRARIKAEKFEAVRMLKKALGLLERPVKGRGIPKSWYADKDAFTARLEVFLAKFEDKPKQ